MARSSDRTPTRRCRAEIRVETPAGPWTVRLASTISDDPAGLLWDTEGLLVMKYGFHVYAFEARTGELRWSHRSASPVLVVLGSSRLAHVLVQAEVETFALEPDGEVAWRVAHSDVVTEAELVGGRLVLTSFDGQVRAIDPATGRAPPSARRACRVPQVRDFPLRDGAGTVDNRWITRSRVHDWAVNGG